jgi:hypothetical protein
MYENSKQATIDKRESVTLAELMNEPDFINYVKYWNDEDDLLDDIIAEHGESAFLDKIDFPSVENEEDAVDWVVAHIPVETLLKMLPAKWLEKVWENACGEYAIEYCQEEGLIYKG